MALCFRLSDHLLSFLLNKTESSYQWAVAVTLMGQHKCDSLGLLNIWMNRTVLGSVLAFSCSVYSIRARSKSAGFAATCHLCASSFSLIIQLAVLPVLMMMVKLRVAWQQQSRRRSSRRLSLNKWSDMTFPKRIPHSLIKTSSLQENELSLEVSCLPVLLPSNNEMEITHHAVLLLLLLFCFK